MLLRGARAAEDRAQLASEERLQEYKNYADLKAKIQQACEVRLEEYKASDEMKEKVYREAFRMYASSYNQGLKVAKDAPSATLAILRPPEVDSDGEEVYYREDDNPLPKRASPPPAGPQGEDTIDKPLNDLLSSGSPSPAVSVTQSNQ